MIIIVQATCNDTHALRAIRDGISYQDAKCLNFVSLYGNVFVDYRTFRPVGERIITEYQDEIESTQTPEQILEVINKISKSIINKISKSVVAGKRRK